jgi:hypothetical protein
MHHDSIYSTSSRQNASVELIKRIFSVTSKSFREEPNEVNINTIAQSHFGVGMNPHISYDRILFASLKHLKN